MTGLSHLSPPPKAAARVFGERLPLAMRYAELLATEGITRGLLGPREVNRIWERHLLNCAVISELIPTAEVVVDVGSGAGLPGVALALSRPDLQMHLVESMRRRSDWLTEVAADLRLTNVTIHHRRAEQMVGIVSAGVVVTRAVARLDVLAGWCAPLVVPGGQVLAIKGETAPDEVAETTAALRSSGVETIEILQVGGEHAGSPTTVVRMTMSATAVPGRQPPVSQPSKRKGTSRGAARRPRRGQ